MPQTATDPREFLPRLHYQIDVNAALFAVNASLPLSATELVAMHDAFALQLSPAQFAAMVLEARAAEAVAA